MLRWELIFTGIFLGGLVFSCGCVTINVGQGETTPNLTTPMTSLSTFTIAPTETKNLWTTVVNNNYFLTSANTLNQFDIPLDVNSAYRLTLVGEKRLTVRITPGDKIVAAGVTNYYGIFKTDAYQRNLHVEWIYFSGESTGGSQNVRVNLERYQGDPSIFPDTTNAPEPYRQYN